MDKDRLAAYDILSRIDRDLAYSNIEINKRLEKKDVSNEAFVREIVYGVLRNIYLLDHHIDKLAAKGISSVRSEMLILLRMGLYQIDFMGSVPDYAAVGETVELAKKLFRGKDRFVNGVLRAYLRKKDEISDLSDIKDLTERFGTKYSCAHWIVELLRDKLGDEGAEDYLAAANTTPPLYLHLNPVKGDLESLEKELNESGIDTFRAPGHDEVIEARGKGVLSTKAFVSGRFFVQDLSSAEAVRALCPKPGETVIDTCAAPGGKTFAISGIMGNDGSVTAMDIYENKLRAIEQQAERLGLGIVRTVLHDSVEPLAELVGKADRVICDVPCTGLGVLRRKPEIKYRKVSDRGQKLSEKQYRILESSSLYLKDGGEIMYSTCTVNDIENRDVVRRFLEEHKDFSIAAEHESVIEKDGHDGFYHCLMKKA